MSKIGAFIRNKEDIERKITIFTKAFEDFTELIHINNLKQLPKAFRIYDMIITQVACLSAILEYINKGGDSRGSYLVSNDNGEYEIKTEDQVMKFSLENDFKEKICETNVEINKGINVSHELVDVRPIPKYDSWFENVWKEFREKNIYKQEDLK